MVQNPFCKCLHPKRIVNPYTNESMVVPCGHCQACTLAKNSRYAFQCDLESYSSKHTLFITLTYANRFIPRAMFVDSIERPYGCDLIDKETGEIHTTKHLQNVKLGNLQIQSNDAGVIIQDERIIQCYNADYWNFPGTLEQLESNDTHFYTEELRQKFLKLAKTDGSESNPIILIQKMKK